MIDMKNRKVIEQGKGFLKFDDGRVVYLVRGELEWVKGWKCSTGTPKNLDTYSKVYIIHSLIRIREVGKMTKNTQKEMIAFLKIGIGKSRYINKYPLLNRIKRFFGIGIPIYDIKLSKTKLDKLKGLPSFNTPRSWNSINEEKWITNIGIMKNNYWQKMI